jgi:hypothetical protein
MKKSKIISQRFEDSKFDPIYDSDRFSGATDKVMTTKAHDVGTPKVFSGRGP